LAGFLLGRSANRLHQGEELLLAGILRAELFGGDLQEEGEGVLARFILPAMQEDDESIYAVGRALALGQQVAPGLEARVNEEGAQAGIAVHRRAAQKSLA
jgi:hypothetical protein